MSNRFSDLTGVTPATDKKLTDQDVEDIVEEVKERVDRIKEEISDVKNFIYKNIYNNLVNIYKAKGTEKSFRNFR